jgi:hypothetical protein
MLVEHRLLLGLLSPPKLKMQLLILLRLRLELRVIHPSHSRDYDYYRHWHSLSNLEKQQGTYEEIQVSARDYKGGKYGQE